LWTHFFIVSLIGFLYIITENIFGYTCTCILFFSLPMKYLKLNWHQIIFLYIPSGCYLEWHIHCFSHTPHLLCLH
jgi:hypothetical protein